MKYLVTLLLMWTAVFAQSPVGTPQWYKDYEGKWYCIGCSNNPTSTTYTTRSLGTVATPGPDAPVQARSFTQQTELNLDLDGVTPECGRYFVPLLAYEYPIYGSHKLASNLPYDYIPLQGIYKFYDRPVQKQDGSIIYMYYLALTFSSEQEARNAVQILHTNGFNTAFYMGMYRNYTQILVHRNHPDNRIIVPLFK